MRPKRVVIDTANEIDDQFALGWALLAPEQLDVIEIHATPFSHGSDFTALAAAVDHRGGGAATAFEEMALGVGPGGITSMLERRSACAAASTRSTECSMPQTLPHPMQRARPSSPEPIASWRRPTMRSTATQSGDSSPPRPSSSTSRATKSLPCCPCHSPSSSNTLQDAVRSTISSWSCTTRILSQRRRPPPGHSWVMWDLAPIAWLIDSTWVPTHRTAGATLDPGHRWRSAEGSLTEAFRVDNDPLSGCAV